ncbi:hypothetical protein LSM04_008269 [Trypanosoma melophagium]|uniref:uncharacterized protein n=1 Tax=Trypanosoma melophagium TaxID=715481 RepID=UPI00351A1B77|nr:hypothetical protein LSM04_008269 [Trypanosoma melophagium]
MVSEEGRIRDYEDRLWDYPDNTLKVIPCIPLFEIALMYVTLRYEILRDKAKYFVIRYDLYNGLSNVLIIHTLLFAIPQFLLQYYITELSEPKGADFEGYKLLTGVNYALYGMSMYLSTRKIFFNYSCNSFGFAMMAVSRALVTPFGTATRMLIVMTIFYLEYNVASYVVSLLYVRDCSVELYIVLIFAGILTALEIAGLVMMFVFEISLLIGFVCTVAIVMEVSFSSFVAAKTLSMDDALCMSFVLNSETVTPFFYVTFAVFCITFVLWVMVEIFNRVTGRQLLSYWENYYYWSRLSW